MATGSRHSSVRRRTQAEKSFWCNAIVCSSKERSHGDCENFIGGERRSQRSPLSSRSNGIPRGRSKRSHRGVNAVDREKQPALMIAAQRDDAKVTKVLLGTNADLQRL